MRNLPCYTKVSRIAVKFLGFAELDWMIILVYLDLQKYVAIHVFQWSTFRDFFGKISEKNCPIFCIFLSRDFFKNILVTAEIFQSAGFVQFFVLYRLVYFSEFQKLNFREKKVKNDNYYEISKIKGGFLFD